MIDLPESHPRRGTRSAEVPAAGLCCTVCDRSAEQVHRLMSGNRMYICDQCVWDTHTHRDERRVPDHEDLGCGFCRKSIFEVDSLYRARTFLLCNRCLDSCLSLLRREEVERFLLEHF